MEKPKKKILAIAHWYPNIQNPYSGIFIKNHMEAIDIYSDVVLVDFSIQFGNSLYQKKVTRKENENGLDVIHIHIKSRLYKYIYYALFFQKHILNKALKKEKVNVSEFDLILSNVIFPSGILGANLAKRYKKNFTLIEHWSYFSTFLKKDIYRNQGRKALKYCKNIVVVSNVLKQVVEKVCDSSKITVIPNIISSDFSLMEKKLDNNLISFLAISRWIQPKNPFLFINALEVLAKTKKHPNFKLTLIGNGSQLKEIQSMNLSFNIDYIGDVPNNEIPNYFQKTHFFLHGSDYETFSIVGIEALMTGTPVICSDVGVLSDVINDSNGILCKNSIESWVDGITKGLNRKYNYELISIAQKDKFSKVHVGKLFNELFNGVQDK